MAGTELGIARKAAVVGAIMLSAFSFNTTENLPIGLLKLMAEDLDVSLQSVGFLVSGYGLTVAVASLPLAHLTRRTPRRLVLCGVLAVLFLASLLPALVTSYGLLLVARVATALAQALFWAVMGPVAVGLFSPAVRGRVIGLLSVGGALATVAGVPAGNWLGRRTDWQVPFEVLSVLVLVALVVIAMFLPSTRPEEGHAAYGAEPDSRRFAAVLAVTALSVTGVFAGFTYVVDFLQETSEFSGDAVSGLLGAFGLGGFLGVTVAGPLLDRFPRATLTVPVTIQAVGLLALYAGAHHQVVVTIAIAVLGAAAAPVFMATQSWILRVAPGRTEIALAANSAAFNVGVAVGALCGGLVLHVLGVRETFLVGGLLTVASLGVLAVEALLPARPPAAAAQDAPQDGKAADAVP
ncbi:MFS transporter [Streptomyces sp. NPDC059850]|uniref:MFS transporter n=1 Tax=Streptomyces sp. NPDC059850 TaxID=3346970 RepID=UPI00365E0BB9